MIDFKIDLVVPFVTPTREWQRRYAEFCLARNYKERLNSALNERYRDHGFFRYFMRGIASSLPFINRVHLILQDIDQIPSWVNRDEVHIVLHKDFIPLGFLPTYNSTTIEMFLDRIPGLAEHFIYCNDDMYALKPMVPEDFFTEDGKIKMSFTQKKHGTKQFDIVCERCFTDVSAALNLAFSKGTFAVPGHEWTPMIKSHITKVKELLPKIADSCTNFRSPKNYNQYIYPLYELMTKNVVQERRDYYYTNMEKNTDQIREIITNGSYKILVINDTEKTDMGHWAQNKGGIIDAFSKRFDSACKYESNIKVSVCICMYNAADTIKRCLRSIPDRPDLEIIVLDDASTDQSVSAAVEEIQSGAHTHYAVYRNKTNRGVGYNRNILIGRSNGEYIYFLDSDDWLFTDTFNEVVESELATQSILSTKYVRNDGFTEYPTILRGVFIKRDYIGGVRHDPNKRCYEDVDFKKRLKAANGGTLDVSFCDKTTYHYNKPRIGSITWDYRKSIGDPAYQGDESEWERFKIGKRG